MGNYVHYRLNFANQPAHSLNESPERRTTKILNFQPQQMKAAKQNQNLLVSAVVEKSQDIG